MRDSRCYNQDICGTITPQTKKKKENTKRGNKNCEI